MIIDPDYPKVILSFGYRDFKIEITRDEFAGQDCYVAWANHQYGCAVAVPYAMTSKIAIKGAKKWVDKRIEQT